MKSTLLLFSLFAATVSFSQINYLPVSIKEATNKAQAEGKLVLLQFESKACQQCNEVADKGMSDAKLSALINRTFIPIKIGIDHPDRIASISKYNLVNTFGTLFIDGAGTLIHKTASSSTMPDSYFQNIDMALNKASEGMKVSLLEKEYRDGNKSPGFIEVLLLKKQTLNLATQDLLDEYVNLLPSDSLTSLRTLVFIAKMAPLLHTSAHYALRRNVGAFNTAWYSIPQNIRVGINNRIISNSLQKAIETNNEAYAFQTAEFAGMTQGGVSFGASKTYDRQLMRFYRGINDTDKYLNHAVAYYDKYFMSLNPDSLIALDERRKQEVFAAVPNKDTVRTGPNSYTITKRVAYRPYSQQFTSELLEGAGSIYELTAAPALLETATEWTKRAIAIFKTPEALDIYAKLLYKQKHAAAAIAAQTELITLRSQRGFPIKENEALLQKMKGGEALD